MIKSKIIPTILIVFTILGLISLGFWQLDRAKQKRLIENKIIQAKKIPAQEIPYNEIVFKPYYNIFLTGKYDSAKQFIYDNQIVNSTAGYFVLTPFVLKNNQAILVNRGFIPWKGRRDKIEDITVNENKQTIKVQLIRPVERIKLKQQKLQTNFPIIIQSLNIKQMRILTNYEIVPMLAQLDVKQKYGFIRQWLPFYGSVAKHVGYAIQWFVMAFVLMIIGLLILRKK